MCISDIKRGEIYFADLGESTIGSVQSGIRPVLVIQNDVGNKFSPTVIVVPITSQKKKMLPTHVIINKSLGLLPKTSICLCEQITVLSKERLLSYVGKANTMLMTKVNIALSVSIALSSIKTA